MAAVWGRGRWVGGKMGGEIEDKTTGMMYDSPAGGADVNG